MFQLHEVDTRTAEEAPSIVGSALCVVFADVEAIAMLREAGAGSIALEAEVSVSDDDSYLLVPSDIGVELVDILRDGDLELLHEAMRDSLVVSGEVHSAERGSHVLHADWVRTPATMLTDGLEFAAAVSISSTDDALATINRLPHVQCTMLSALFDADGLSSVLSAAEYAGTSWRLPERARRLEGGVDPTFVWSRRLPDGTVGIELALFVEQDDLVALLRPLKLLDSRSSQAS